LKTRNFDFFIIDWNLPDIGGDEVLKYVREHCGWDVPVIFCTGRTEEDAASDILRLGADDYIPKPIRYMEFMARIHALLRRRKPRPATLQYGNIEIDLEGRRIKLAGNEVDLTQREYELALILLRNIGRVLSRDELLTSVWVRDAGVDTRTVDTHASRLRKSWGWQGEWLDAVFRIWAGLSTGHCSARLIPASGLGILYKIARVLPGCHPNPEFP
jgi:DNA-binding response OmpR family regulator